MITYPVDVANTRWAMWRISLSQIEKHNQKWPHADGSEIVGLNPDVVPLLEVQEAQPNYNPSTHKLQAAAPVVDVPNNTHTHGWDVVALTAEEIAAITEREAAKAVYQDLKNHVGTQTERLIRCENVLAYILKDTYAAS